MHHNNNNRSHAHTRAQHDDDDDDDDDDDAALRRALKIYPRKKSGFCFGAATTTDHHHHVCISVRPSPFEARPRARVEAFETRDGVVVPLGGVHSSVDIEHRTSRAETQQRRHESSHSL